MRKGFKKMRKQLARLRGWCSHRLRYQYGVGDLLAAHQIAPMSAAQCGPVQGGTPVFLAQGDDPQFRLSQPLAAGWYMAEVKMQAPDGMANARFYLDMGEGESETMAWGLPVRSGRMAKRLLRVPASARLRFDPMAQEGEFRLQHFRVVRMPVVMALRRLRKKLQRSQHPSTPPAAALGLEESWRNYNAIFEPMHGDAVSYERWIEAVEAPQIPSLAQQQASMQGWPWKPTISIVLPTYNTPEPLLRECLDSVLAQTYPHWELCIADDASTQPHVKAVLEHYAAQDARIKLKLRKHNGHISESSNSALELATGEFVALLDHDDMLPAHALFTVMQTLQTKPAAQILYSDEDKLDEAGRRCDPFFKPDWSPDLLFSQNYMVHLLVYRRSLLQSVGGFRKGYEGSQDYDLLLRCIASLPASGEIVHIPQILYHWRKTAGSTAMGHDQKDYATPAAQRALQEFMDQRHPGVQVGVTQPGIYRHRWPIPADAPLVSLIIPTRDGLEHLRKCIESILDKTSYPHYEIIVVDNQSTCPHTLDYLQNLENGGARGARVSILRYDHPFNYSAINNFAARQASGTILGLINNDVEVISADWLTEMVSHAVRPDIGCVGAKLYYPDGTLQHAGVVLGIGGVAGHSHKYFPRTDGGYFGRLLAVHNVCAVTGAALLVRKSVFEQVGMLDEQGLRVAFNDVDFCIKVHKAGYRNLWTPFSELYHHESKSRGDDDTPEKKARFSSECLVMTKRWGDFLRNDPYYNQNLTLIAEDYSLSLNGIGK